MCQGRQSAYDLYRMLSQDVEVLSLDPERKDRDQEIMSKFGEDEVHILDEPSLVFSVGFAQRSLRYNAVQEIIPWTWQRVPKTRLPMRGWTRRSRGLAPTTSSPRSF
eukprot:TRINITY_DN16933_c0_g4_i1.p1 TRINITY_DN16933_c0_g4~~TRINITY_DN16933_c0_g4_i1.p1  ORF type:complete len:107 (+),score=8.01 TRINITY_DN16933_c0_g4_i1:71-391(+)